MADNIQFPSIERFPSTFSFGVTANAYQIEGAHSSYGKGESIWDIFSHCPDKIYDHSNGNIACDTYHLYKEDILLLRELGCQNYQFSISWSRILPTGRVDNINQTGLDYYNSLIDCLIENGIIPSITLYCWDYPMALHREYEGWLSEKSHDDFLDYAELCFDIFGDRVKKWITINEPWTIAILGHALGTHAPGHSDKPGTEPYIVIHNIILAHAKVVRLFRSKYEGQISITNCATWWHPDSRSEEDNIAAKRAMAFTLGWILDPIMKGDYPSIMREIVGDRLPKFTEDEKVLIKGSSDFIAINHYTTIFASNISARNILKNIMSPTGLQGGEDTLSVMKNKYHYFKDMKVVSNNKDLNRTDMGWYVAPMGLSKILQYLHKHYSGEIHILESGYAGFELDYKSAINDHDRIKYFDSYIHELHKAIQKGVNVKCYNAWTLLDCYEWHLGYTKKFGLVHVDFNTQERTPKLSYYWLSKLFKTMKL